MTFFQKHAIGPRADRSSVAIPIGFAPGSVLGQTRKKPSPCFADQAGRSGGNFSATKSRIRSTQFFDRPRHARNGISRFHS